MCEFRASLVLSLEGVMEVVATSLLLLVVMVVVLLLLLVTPY